MRTPTILLLLIAVSSGQNHRGHHFLPIHDATPTRNAATITIMSAPMIHYSSTANRRPVSSPFQFASSNNLPNFAEIFGVPSSSRPQSLPFPQYTNYQTFPARYVMPPAPISTLTPTSLGSYVKTIPGIQQISSHRPIQIPLSVLSVPTTKPTASTNSVSTSPQPTVQQQQQQQQLFQFPYSFSYNSLANPVTPVQNYVQHQPSGIYAPVHQQFRYNPGIKTVYPAYQQPIYVYYTNAQPTLTPVTTTQKEIGSQEKIEQKQKLKAFSGDILKIKSVTESPISPVIKSPVQLNIKSQSESTTLVPDVSISIVNGKRRRKIKKGRKRINVPNPSPIVSVSSSSSSSTSDPVYSQPLQFLSFDRYGNSDSSTLTPISDSSQSLEDSKSVEETTSSSLPSFGKRRRKKIRKIRNRVTKAIVKNRQRAQEQLSVEKSEEKNDEFSPVEYSDEIRIL